MSREHPDYITTFKGGSGWMAVHLRWYLDINSYDVWQSGDGRYATKEEAETEGREWAEGEGMEFRP